MNRRLKSKTGISPILATLLLIIIAVAAIVVTYAWILAYMGNAGQQATVNPFMGNVGFNGDGVTTPKTISIYVGNSGTGAGTITAIYIGNSSSSEQLQEAVTPPLPVNLPANGNAPAITITYDWSKGSTYYIKVQCNTGAILPWSGPAQ